MQLRTSRQGLDCKGWWSSSCRSSVAEHWLHKPGVLGSISNKCQLFPFTLLCLITSSRAPRCQVCVTLLCVQHSFINDRSPRDELPRSVFLILLPLGNPVFGLRPKPFKTRVELISLQRLSLKTAAICR